MVKSRRCQDRHMGSRDLRRQLAELRAQVEALQPSHVSDELRAYFAAAAFDGQREAIIQALLDGRLYEFAVQLPDDPAGCPSRYIITWPDRRQPPKALRICYIR